MVSDGTFPNYVDVLFMNKEFWQPHIYIYMCVCICVYIYMNNDYTWILSIAMFDPQRSPDCFEGFWSANWSSNQLKREYHGHAMDIQLMMVWLVMLEPTWEIEILISIDEHVLKNAGETINHLQYNRRFVCYVELFLCGHWIYAVMWVCTTQSSYNLFPFAWQWSKKNSLDTR